MVAVAVTVSYSKYRTRWFRVNLHFDTHARKQMCVCVLGGGRGRDRERQRQMFKSQGEADGAANIPIEKDDQCSYQSGFVGEHAQRAFFRHFRFFVSLLYLWWRWLSVHPGHLFQDGVGLVVPVI